MQILSPVFEENTLSDKEICQEKLKNDFELAQATLAEFKAKIQSVAGGVRSENVGRIDLLEQRTEEAKQRLLVLNRTQDIVPEQIIEGIENTWSALQDSLQDVISTFEGDH